MFRMVVVQSREITQRSTINDQPSTINDQRSTINDQRSTINHQPSTTTFLQEPVNQCVQQMNKLSPGTRNRKERSFSYEVEICQRHYGRCFIALRNCHRSKFLLQNFGSLLSQKSDHLSDPRKERDV